MQTVGLEIPDTERAVRVVHLRRSVCHAISGALSVMVGWCEGGDVDYSKQFKLVQIKSVQIRSGGDADGGPRDP